MLHERAGDNSSNCLLLLWSGHEYASGLIVFLSSDLSHDFNAVLAFLKNMYEYLKNIWKVTIETEFRYTDGCSAQYKSIDPFLFLVIQPWTKQHNSEELLRLRAWQVWKRWWKCHYQVTGGSSHHYWQSSHKECTGFVQLLSQQSFHPWGCIETCIQVGKWHTSWWV